MQPQIVIDSNTQGIHNTDLEKTIKRLEASGAYRDLSTICIIPTRGMVPAKAVQSWWNISSPMNQKFIRMFAIQMEVGSAYSEMINQILANPELSSWKYILTLEEDNLPPPDGLLKLYEGMSVFDVVGGLYWTKGEAGMPMIYGNPNEIPLNFKPQMPLVESIQECNGLGMGFTLFKLDIFKDTRLEKPFFRTLQENGKAYTQDLYFFEKLKGLGYKVACDTRVKVGHYDYQGDIVW